MSTTAPRWHQRGVARIGATLVALLSLAFSAAAAELLARDAKAQFGVDEARVQDLATLAQLTAPTVPLMCTEGFAGPYPCQNLDLLGLVTVPEIGVGLGSDVWGWTDPADGREIAIPTTTFGAAFVDVTDPTSPVVLGRLDIATDDSGVLWRDVKVHADHAYLVSEHGSTHLQIFDLTRLRGVTSDQGLFTADAVYTEFDNAHNLEINDATATAYAVGTNTCSGGLHMIDLADPAAPVFAGCFAEDGYSHDVHCVVYDGLDTRYTDHEICFASNEDTLTIVDVTDRAEPELLARIGYPEATYTHQGWITPDHQWFVFGDELDEQGFVVDSTVTYWVRLADLTDSDTPVLSHAAASNAVDHNLYIHDGYIWEANYTAGVRVFSYTDESLAAGSLTEVAWFDVDPGPEGPVYAGAWTVYPFFPSGTIVANSFDAGMYVLGSSLPGDGQPGPQGDAGPAPALPGLDDPTGVTDPATDATTSDPASDDAAPAPTTTDPSSAPDAAGVESAAADLPATGGGAGAIGLGLLAMGAAARRRRRRPR